MKDIKSEQGFVFFWGSFLSNFHLCSFKIDDVDFKSSEHAFMMFKALHFDDVDSVMKINQAEKPGKAKRLGKKVKGFDPAIWNAVSFDYMEQACVAKFTQNEDIKAMLLATGDNILVEASPYDCIWGIGMGLDNPLRFDQSKWLGENRLGKVLMKVRRTLRELL